MGIISRHSGEPFADGEVLSGTDLEQDFNTIYTEFNGSINNANIASGANIDGSKLADDSIATAKLNDDAVTRAKIADAFYTGVGMSSSVGAANLASASTSWTTIPGLSAVNVTPTSTDDWIICDGELSGVTSATTGAVVSFGFTVYGTNNGVAKQGFDNVSFPDHVRFSFAVQATATTAATITPIYMHITGVNVTLDTSVFRWCSARIEKG